MSTASLPSVSFINNMSAFVLSCSSIVLIFASIHFALRLFDDSFFSFQFGLKMLVAHFPLLSGMSDFVIELNHWLGKHYIGHFKVDPRWLAPPSQRLAARPEDLKWATDLGDSFLRTASVPQRISAFCVGRDVFDPTLRTSWFDLRAWRLLRVIIVALGASRSSTSIRTMSSLSLFRCRSSGRTG